MASSYYHLFREWLTAQPYGYILQEMAPYFPSYLGDPIDLDRLLEESINQDTGEITDSAERKDVANHNLEFMRCLEEILKNWYRDTDLISCYDKEKGDWDQARLGRITEQMPLDSLVLGSSIALFLCQYHINIISKSCPPVPFEYFKFSVPETDEQKALIFSILKGQIIMATVQELIEGEQCEMDAQLMPLKATLIDNARTFFNQANHIKPTAAAYVELATTYDIDDIVYRLRGFRSIRGAGVQLSAEADKECIRLQRELIKCKKYLDKGLELDPRHPLLRKALAFARALEDFDDCKFSFEDALALSPYDYDLYFRVFQQLILQVGDGENDGWPDDQEYTVDAAFNLISRAICLNERMPDYVLECADFLCRYPLSEGSTTIAQLANISDQLNYWIQFAKENEIHTLRVDAGIGQAECLLLIATLLRDLSGEEIAENEPEGAGVAFEADGPEKNRKLVDPQDIPETLDSVYNALREAEEAVKLAHRKDNEGKKKPDDEMYNQWMSAINILWVKALDLNIEISPEAEILEDGTDLRESFFARYLQCLKFSYLTHPDPHSMMQEREGKDTEIEEIDTLNSETLDRVIDKCVSLSDVDSVIGDRTLSERLQPSVLFAMACHLVDLLRKNGDEGAEVHQDSFIDQACALAIALRENAHKFREAETVDVVVGALYQLRMSR